LFISFLSFFCSDVLEQFRQLTKEELAEAKAAAELWLLQITSSSFEIVTTVSPVLTFAEVLQKMSFRLPHGGDDSYAFYHAPCTSREEVSSNCDCFSFF
jgi:hypothetical protein